MARVYLFKGFERFWHWSQAALIIFMLLTGFEVHGTYSVFGFEKAVNFHTLAAWTLVGLWVFAIFWHLTTGEWRQYIPTTKKSWLWPSFTHPAFSKVSHILSNPLPAISTTPCSC